MFEKKAMMATGMDPLRLDGPPMHLRHFDDGTHILVGKGQRGWVIVEDVNVLQAAWWIADILHLKGSLQLRLSKSSWDVSSTSMLISYF